MQRSIRGCCLRETRLQACGAAVAQTAHSGATEVSSRSLCLFPPAQADSFIKPQYTTTFDCISRTIKAEGQAGLWRGFSAAMYRAIPVNAGIFLAVEATRQGIKW
jgi:hypothetical protein